jgi:DNA-binding transcriptional regulator YdaS (Cro superfamily)
MTVDIERGLLRRAIRAAGGYARLAAGLGISRQTIYLWKRVPEHWIIEIERVSGIPRHELRPDLCREPLTVDIERDAAETDLWFEARGFECYTISAMPRFQPPPRRTQHADFSHCALLFAPPQGFPARTH